jgi:hypothetical protein
VSLAYGCVFDTFSPRIDKVKQGNRKILPPRVSPRTGDKNGKNATFSIHFFACPHISGNKRLRGRTVCNRGGISGKGRYTAAARYRL